jgi:hypothetical protein
VSTDYFPPIQRAVQNLSPNTLEARRALYDKARAALLKQLRGADPALTESQITKERLLLEDAIRRIETDMLRPETATRILGDPKPSPQPPSASQLAARPKLEPVEAAELEPAPDYDDALGEEPYEEVQQEVPAPAPRRMDRQRPAAPQRRDAKPGRTRTYIAAAIAALVVVGGGAGVMALLPSDLIAPPIQPVSSNPPAPAQKEPATTPSAGGPAQDPSSASSVGKLTDRLGDEPPKPAERASAAGTAPAPSPSPSPSPAPAQPAAPPQQEAALQQPAPPPSSAAQPLSPAPHAGAAVTQQAILYEEQPDSPQRGQAFQGTIAWRTESVSSGSNAPLDTAIKGDIDIPERKIHATLTLRKNADPALPASHTLEIQFVVPNDFPNGGISNVPGVLMKQAAQQRGAPLQGLSVKVTNGFFLIGLSDAPTDSGRNAQLLKEREWIDIPVLYDNGRRAILTLEKGVPGNRAFSDAFNAWDSPTAAAQP